MYAHLLDQHVQVLRDIGSEAYFSKVSLSAHDRTEAICLMHCENACVREHASQPLHVHDRNIAECLWFFPRAFASKERHKKRP